MVTWGNTNEMQWDTNKDIKQNREKEGLQQGGIREDNAGE